MLAKRRVIITLWLAGLVLGGLVIAHTGFTTDMSAFLPRSPRPAQQILVDQLRSGVVSRMVLLAIEGAPPDTIAALSTLLAGTLRQDPAFAIVNNGDNAAFARDQDLLWRYRYLLSPAAVPGQFSATALHAALQADLQLLGSAMGSVAARTVPADPTGEMLRLIDALGGQGHPALHDGVWVSPGGQRALLMVQTAAPGFDLDAQEHALDRIAAVFAAAQRDVPANLRAAAALARLAKTGPPVFAVETRARMKSDVERLSLIATVLVAGILLFAYRSITMLVLSLFPVLSGVVAGIACVSLAFGFVHAITLGFGVTLIGEAVDYAVYLLSQTAPGAAPAQTLPRIWPTLRLGMLTSVCGFSAMLLSSFTGFAQLGLFTITGLIVALSVTRWVLPALLPRSFSTIASLAFAIPMLALIRAGAKLRYVVAGLAAIAVLLLVLHRGPYWDDGLASMSPLPAEQKSLDEQLRRELGAPDVRYLVVAQAADSDAALAASELAAAQLQHLVATGIIGGFETPATWLPSLATQRQRQAALPGAATLAANLDQAAEGTPFRVAAFAPFLADVAAARSQPLLHRRDLDGTSLALRLDSLLVQANGRWLAMLPLRGVADSAAVAEAVAGMHDGALVFLDLKAQSDELLGSYLHEALTLALAGSAAITALLGVSLQSWRRTARVLLPLAAAVLCTAALLLTAAGPLLIFNLFGLLLVAAVGSNYCLFFEGLPPGTDAVEHRRVVASLVIADLCTVIGFGILSFSFMPVLYGIGLTVAIGACLSLLFSAILSAAPRATGR